MKKFGLIITLLATVFITQDALATTATAYSDLKPGHYYRLRSGRNHYMCLVRDESTGGLATSSGTGKIQPVVLLTKDHALACPGSIFKYSVSGSKTTLTSQNTTVNAALDGKLVGAEKPYTDGLTVYSARWGTNDVFQVTPVTTQAGETRMKIETQVTVLTASKTAYVQDENTSAESFLAMAGSAPATDASTTWYFEEVSEENMSDNALTAAYASQSYNITYKYPTNTSGGTKTGSKSSQYLVSDMVQKTEDGTTWYYATMRVPFPVLVPSNVQCFFVNSKNEAVAVEWGNGKFTRRGAAVKVIPANTPFLYRSTSVDPKGVQFLPVSDDNMSNLAAFGGSTSDGNVANKSVNKLVNATTYYVNTANSNGLYGRYSSNKRYTLAMSGNDVKFSKELETSDVTDGNRAYYSKTSEPIVYAPTPVELVDLIKGEYDVNDYVSIKDDIVVGYVNESAGIVYAHDKQNNKDYTDLQPVTETPDNYYNFAPNNEVLYPADYQQSNWVAIKVPAGIEIFKPGYIIPGESLTGAIDNEKTNPVFNYMAAPESLTTQADAEYLVENTYCVANLMAGSDHLVNSPVKGQDFWFMTPRAQEVATITWAVLDIENGQVYAYIPSNSNEGANGNGFLGKVKLDLVTYYNGGTLTEDQVNKLKGQVLNFRAVVLKLDNSSSAAPRRVAVDSDSPESANYELAMLELGANNGVVTSLSDFVANAKTVKDVRFFNLQGVAKSEPWDGVNIIVREFTDGTRDSKKVIF